LIAALLLILVAQALACVPANAQMSGGDFCQGPNPAKSSAAISITSSGSGEHQLIAAVANQGIHVCAYVFDLGGTNPTAEFDYGTQTSTACDTGTTALTSAMTASKAAEGPLDFFTAPAGNSCV
jgi:hypothetical protein